MGELMGGCNCNQISDWTAILNKMPPDPPTLTVAGKVTCATGGYRVSLAKAVPQGLNPRELILEVVVSKEPGSEVNQMVTEYQVVPYIEQNADYDYVRIVPCDFRIKVEVVW